MEETKFINTSRPFLCNDGQILSKVDLDNIEHINTCNGKCEIHLCDGKSKTVNTSLNKFEATLPPDIFVRINRSTIINIWYIKKIIGKGVITTTGKHFDLGETYLNALDNKFTIIGKI